MSTKAVVITPDLASEMLSKNAKNRPLRQRVVAKYAADMRAGAFVGADSIKIGEDGALQDGQHRLAAVIESGIPVTMVVVDNLPTGAFDKWDTGAKRSPGDVVSILGYPQSALVASVAQAHHLYTVNGSPEKNGSKAAATAIKNRDLHDFLGAPNSGGLGDKIVNACRVAERTGLKTLTSPSVGGFCVLAFSLASDAGLAEEFASSVGVGAGLAIGHPALTVRNQILNEKARSKGKVPQTWMCAVLFKAWNSWLGKGPHPKYFRWTMTDQFPALDSIF